MIAWLDRWGFQPNSRRPCSQTDLSKQSGERLDVNHHNAHGTFKYSIWSGWNADPQEAVLEIIQKQ